MKNWSCIVNLDSKTGPGTHWVAFRHIKDAHCEYFDSYGLPPPNEIIKFADELDKKILSSHILLYNHDELQDLHTVTCGWWCLYFLLERQKGKSWLQTLHPVSWYKGKGKKFLLDYFSL